MIDEQPRQRGQLHPGQVGKAAEEAVIRYFTQTKQLAEDTRADPYWRIRDVDLILKDRTTIEVKGDTWLHKTGNLFFEVSRDHGGAGCFFRSKADFWYYVDAETYDCFAFKLSDAQSWLAMHFDTEDCVWTPTRSHRRVQGVARFVDYGGYKVRLEALRSGIAVQQIRLGGG